VRKGIARLDDLIEAATVDCDSDSQAVTGFYTMLEEHLQVPFTTEVLGMKVSVEGVDVTEADEIVAVCRRGRFRQRVAILDLPLPRPLPKGVEWIEAFRRWSRGR
jgi:hypothetical protein